MRDFYYWRHVVFLTLLKIALLNSLDLSLLLYPKSICVCTSMHYYIYIDTALWWTICIMFIGCCNYKKLGLLVMSAWYYIILVTVFCLLNLKNTYHSTRFTEFSKHYFWILLYFDNAPYLYQRMPIRLNISNLMAVLYKCNTRKLSE